jgi:hypothetical protein
VEDSCEHGHEPSGPRKCWEVLEQLHNQQPLKKVLDTCSYLVILV